MRCILLPSDSHPHTHPCKHSYVCTSYKINLFQGNPLSNYVKGLHIMRSTNHAFSRTISLQNYCLCQTMTSERDILLPHNQAYMSFLCWLCWICNSFPKHLNTVIIYASLCHSKCIGTHLFMECHIKHLKTALVALVHAITMIWEAFKLQKEHKKHNTNFPHFLCTIS